VQLQAAAGAQEAVQEQKQEQQGESPPEQLAQQQVSPLPVRLVQAMAAV
jgi:hypothetical protein